MTSQDTRTRILVKSLLLFNERGEPNTPTNAIADEADISPGNLHYHFRKKSDLVAALLSEFQADMRRVFEPPPRDEVTVDDFWIFLHLLLEVLAAYRFLLRDMETLIASYPKVAYALRAFVRALTAQMELYVGAMRQSGVLCVTEADVPDLSRNLVVITLFSERLDAITDAGVTADSSSLRVARAVLGILLPFATRESAPLLAALAERYRH